MQCLCAVNAAGFGGMEKASAVELWWLPLRFQEQDQETSQKFVTGVGSLH